MSENVCMKYKTSPQNVHMHAVPTSPQLQLTHIVLSLWPADKALSLQRQCQALDNRSLSSSFCLSTPPPPPAVLLQRGGGGGREREREREKNRNGRTFFRPRIWTLKNA